MNFLKTRVQIVVAIVVILFGLHYYLSKYTEITVAEVKCQTSPTTFTQVNEYAPIVGLWATSDGNMQVTFDNGTKAYFSDIEMLCEGNQKVALILNDPQWQRYVFGSKKLYYDGVDYDCVNG